MAFWYVSSVGYLAVAIRAPSTAYPAGSLVRRTVASETYANQRVWVSSGGTSSGTATLAWNTGQGSTTNDNDIVWTEVTGNSAYGWGASGPTLELFVEGWAAAGDTIYVSHQHSETRTGVAITYASVGTLIAPLNIICVNDSVAPPTTLANTAFVATNTTQMGWTGSFYIYGIIFSPGSEGATNNSFSLDSSLSVVQTQIFDNCEIRLTSHASSRFNVGSSGNNTLSHNVLFLNSNFKTNHVNGGIVCYRVNFNWLGGTYVAGAISANLLQLSNGFRCDIVVAGVDLSALSGAANYLVQLGTVPGQTVRFHGGKLAAVNPTVVNGTISGEDITVALDLCNNSGVTTRSELYKYGGSQILSTAVYRNPGASDGVTPYSYNITSLATGPSFYFPLKSKPILRWLDTTGVSKTITMEILHDSLTNLKDNEVWLELDYLGTAGSPKYALASDRASFIGASAADQAASAETWVNAMANPNKQKVSVSVTAQYKGYVRARLCLAKPSKTVYMCPKLAVT